MTVTINIEAWKRGGKMLKSEPNGTNSLLITNGDKIKWEESPFKLWINNKLVCSSIEDMSDKIIDMYLWDLKKRGYKIINDDSSVFQKDEVAVNENRQDFLNWKRKNVTIRGIKEIDEENGAGAMLGDGLYTAALSNSQLAKQYGKIYFVVNAIPKKPLIFNSLNDWQIWASRNIYFINGKYNKRLFYESNKNISEEILNLGYDGIIIKGREMVNYKPDDIKYFTNEFELENYFETL